MFVGRESVIVSKITQGENRGSTDLQTNKQSGTLEQIKTCKPLGAFEQSIYLVENTAMLKCVYAFISKPNQPIDPKKQIDSLICEQKKKKKH